MHVDQSFFPQTALKDAEPGQDPSLLRQHSENAVAMQEIITCISGVRADSIMSS